MCVDDDPRSRNLANGHSSRYFALFCLFQILTDAVAAIWAIGGQFSHETHK
ncbi:hypothetical protein J25TS5_41350 [Paenibacillus faecis]|nr:hypothetical protein J25TS5_41350 [Paenibacillus faecis]